jgi:chromate transporter
MALARTLCTDAATKTVALGAAIISLAVGATAGLQWLPIALGAVAGIAFMRGAAAIGVPALPFTVPRALATGAALVFGITVLALLVPARALPPWLALLETIARAGSLVFGGGHVVLPLLAGLVSDGLVGTSDFFAGYGATQAVPGPLFTFAAFLGAANSSTLHGPAGALVATIVIFAPSFALVFALAPVWNRVRTVAGAASALRGANAAVVGLLGAVLYHPILTSLEPHPAGVAIALAAYALIAVWAFPPWVVVVASGALGALAGLVP